MARPKGPPFTVPRYGSLGESIIAERDWLKQENERLRVAIDKALDWCYRENLYGRGRNALELACTPAPQSEQRSTTEESK